jgi:hypothetical protein
MKLIILNVNILELFALIMRGIQHTQYWKFILETISFHLQC